MPQTPSVRSSVRLDERRVQRALETELLLATGRGDQAAFASLYDRVSGRLFRWTHEMPGRKALE